MTRIDQFLRSVASGAGIPGELYADDAVLDATVPSWRFTARGREAITATYGEWFADPGELEELERHPVPNGEIVRYFLTWRHDGMPYGGHHVHLLSIAADGRIERDTVFCGGRWEAALLAQMAEADR